MEIALATPAESKAREAETLPAFGGINLLHIKRQVAALLALIGRSGIFDEYTKHDISHVNESLKLLDDLLIPEETKRIMSPADWLLTVLSIYFHDLGMLVTKKEFKSRDDTGFPRYRDEILFAGPSGQDYRAKVSSLPSDQFERFLYQEYVRDKHAERIKNWVIGKPQDHLGITPEATSAVDELLKPLSPYCRADLALICESHHLADLDDLRKYKFSQPYGNSEAETANIQYCAILLRSADLLHITSDRAPSIAFKVLSPTDPLSQQEWAKQIGVRRIRSKVARDADGKQDEKLPRDTIEVHANFTQEDAFFGLTSYLVYVDGQLKKCYSWNQLSRRQGSHHIFPWRHIDDTNIEAEGFIKTTFGFSIDQPRILDLLTGHTLYNDTAVVVRELAQNALDAVRLQHMIDKQANPNAHIGNIRIHWDSNRRILSVEDNGAGMTQNIIENNLLKIGASLYQDQDFKKKYPEFSPISQFGIGILSSFMVADTVEIFTCHPDDQQARYIALRSVHGRYLIRLLDKDSDETAKRLKPHGTLVRLTLRPSAVIQDVLEIAKLWIVVPGCDVSFSIDDSAPVRVGFDSPKAALEQALRDSGIFPSDATQQSGVVVMEKQLANVTLAYALEWSDYFKEYSFLTTRVQPQSVGTCIEGIRVEFTTPGFFGYSFAAIADCRGPLAPKTNVARSGLDTSPESLALLERLCILYCKHIANEMRELHETRGFSLTWAMQESRWLLPPLLSEEPAMYDYRSLPAPSGRLEERPSLWRIIQDQIKRLPLLLVERDSKRVGISVDELMKEAHFWTIDCALFEAAESILREAPSETSLYDLASRVPAMLLPTEPVLCSLQYSPISELVYGNREVDFIKVNRSLRRIDLRWSSKSDPPRWSSLSNYPKNFGRGISRHRLLSMNIFVSQSAIKVEGLSNEVAIRAFNNLYIFHGSKLAAYLSGFLNDLALQPDDPKKLAQALSAISIINSLLSHAASLIHQEEISQEHIRRLLLRLQDEVIEVVPEARDFRTFESILDIQRLCDVVNNTNLSAFDRTAWLRED